MLFVFSVLVNSAVIFKMESLIFGSLIIDPINMTKYKIYDVTPTLKAICSACTSSLLML